MAKFIFKGETEKATTYEFDVMGKQVIVSSNAARYEDAITAAGLPADAKLVKALSYPIYDGVKNKEKHTDIIWAYIGTLPSGKEAIKYLVEKGCLTKEEAYAIYSADEVRL